MLVHTTSLKRPLGRVGASRTRCQLSRRNDRSRMRVGSLCFRHALADVVIERCRTPIVGFAEVHVQSFRVVLQRLQSHKMASSKYFYGQFELIN